MYIYIYIYTYIYTGHPPSNALPASQVGSAEPEDAELAPGKGGKKQAEGSAEGSAEVEALSFPCSFGTG